MVMSFFSRWVKGMKVYLSNPTDLLFLKLLFLGFVVFGLFAGSVQMFVSDNFWIGFVMLAFGFVSSVDFRMLLLSYRKVKRMEGLL